MYIYIPVCRCDPVTRAAEISLREAAGGVPIMDGHAWDVGDVLTLREARDVLARRLPVAWPLHGAALLELLPEARSQAAAAAAENTGV